MVILAAPGRPAALLSGNEMVQFADQSTLGALTNAGIKTVPVTVADYDRFNQGFNKNI